jgi:hypothetical protein
MDKGGTGGPRRADSRRGEEVAVPAPDERPFEPADPTSPPEGLEQTVPDRARHHEYFTRLTPEEKQLLLIRNELYGGSWDEMESDLRRRLERKPYIFRLTNRIEDDLAGIRLLRAYEDQHGVDLGVFLER